MSNIDSAQHRVKTPFSQISMIARAQHGEEFYNTFRRIADIKRHQEVRGDNPQYSSASIIVITRSVTDGSAGSGEWWVRELSK
jgi:hypothetical protein